MIEAEESASERDRIVFRLYVPDHITVLRQNVRTGACLTLLGAVVIAIPFIDEWGPFGLIVSLIGAAAALGTASATALDYRNLRREKRKRMRR